MGNGGQGTSLGGRENEKQEQNKDFKMKLLIRLGVKLRFVPIFHFPFPRARSPF